MSDDTIDDGSRELDVRVGLGMFASEAQLEHLLAVCRQVDVKAGQVLYARDTPATSVFQVMSGEISMHAPDATSWQVSGGGTVGFVDCMTGRPHSRTAVATSAAQLLEIETADYRDYLHDNFEVSHRILAQLCAEVIAGAVARSEAGDLLTSVALPNLRSFSKVELPMVERLTILSRMPAFRGASIQGLANLAQTMRETRYEPGDVIAGAGALPNVVSLLVEGVVQLELPNGRRILRAGRDFVAHVEELTTTPRVNVATAMSGVITLQIEREDLLDRLEEHFDLVMRVLGTVALEHDKLNVVAATSGIGPATNWK